nr:MAK10-like protein [Tanacetum cinerariifolium]
MKKKKRMREKKRTAQKISMLVPQSSNTEVVFTKGDDGEVMFIEIIRKNDDSRKEDTKEEGSTTTEGIIRRKLDPMESLNRGVSNFTGRIKRMHVFIGNFTYVIDFMIGEDISSITDPKLLQVVLRRPFVEISNMNHDPPEVCFYGKMVCVIKHIPQSDSYDEKEKENEGEEKDSSENIHVNPSTPPDTLLAFIIKKVLKFNAFFESLRLVPQSSNTEVVFTKGDDGEVMFIEIIRKNDDSRKEDTKEEGSTTTEGIIRRKLDPMESLNRGVSNFTGRIKRMHVFIGNFTYVIDFMIGEDISSITDPKLLQVVLRRPFVEISNMNHDPPEGVVTFINKTNEVAYKMPHKIE